MFRGLGTLHSNIPSNGPLPKPSYVLKSALSRAFWKPVPHPQGGPECVCTFHSLSPCPWDIQPSCHDFSILLRSRVPALQSYQPEFLTIFIFFFGASFIPWAESIIISFYLLKLLLSWVYQTLVLIALTGFEIYHLFWTFFLISSNFQILWLINIF